MYALKSFDYFEPATVKEAVQILAQYGEKAKILAGGVDLIPRMRKEKTKAEYLVNIQGIPGLNAIKDDKSSGLNFGAMTKLHAIETAETVKTGYPILFEAIHQIASVQAKYMGTAVGNICVATPASDVVTVLMALDAVITITGKSGERKEPIAKFCVDYGRTSLKPYEMVTAVSIPASAAGISTAFMNLVRTRADIAKLTVAAALKMENGTCREARIAIGSAAPTVLRPAKAEKILAGEKLNSRLINDAAEAAAGETKTIDDVRSTAAYRKDMTRLLVSRVIEKALGNGKA